MATTPSSVNNLASLIENLAETNDVILLGDTDHTAGAISTAVYNPKTIDAMGHAGVKHLVLEAGNEVTQLFADTMTNALKAGKHVSREEAKVAARMFDVIPTRLSAKEQESYIDNFLDLVESAHRNGIALHFANYPPEKTIAFIKSHPGLESIIEKTHDLRAQGDIKGVDRYLAGLTPQQKAMHNEYLHILIPERLAINPKLAGLVNQLDGKVAVSYGFLHLVGQKSVSAYLHNKKPAPPIAIVGSDNPAAMDVAAADKKDFYVYDTRSDAVTPGHATAPAGPGAPNITPDQQKSHPGSNGSGGIRLKMEHADAVLPGDGNDTAPNGFPPSTTQRDPSINKLSMGFKDEDTGTVYGVLTGNTPAGQKSQLVVIPSGDGEPRYYNAQASQSGSLTASFESDIGTIRTSASNARLSTTSGASIGLTIDNSAKPFAKSGITLSDARTPGTMQSAPA